MAQGRARIGWTPHMWVPNTRGPRAELGWLEWIKIVCVRAGWKEGGDSVTSGDIWERRYFRGRNTHIHTCITLCHIWAHVCVCTCLTRVCPLIVVLRPVTLNVERIHERAHRRLIKYAQRPRARYLAGLPHPTPHSNCMFDFAHIIERNDYVECNN